MNCGAESESNTSVSLSTHPFLGRPYTSSLPDNSSKSGANTNADADAYGDSIQKNSADSNPSSKNAEGIHRLKTLGLGVHWIVVTLLDRQVDTES